MRVCVGGPIDLCCRAGTISLVLGSWEGGTRTSSFILSTSEFSHRSARTRVVLGSAIPMTVDLRGHTHSVSSPKLAQ